MWFSNIQSVRLDDLLETKFGSCPNDAPETVNLSGSNGFEDP